MDYQQTNELPPTDKQGTSSSRSEPASSLSSPDQIGGDVAVTIETEHSKKKTLAEKVKEEVREIFAIIIYLGCWLSVLATMKCLILLQYGINEFKNAYIMAWITAAALSKVIVLAQKLPIVEHMRERPLFWACLYKSGLFTVITMFAHRLEEKMIHTKVDPNNVFPFAGVVAHTLSLFAIFFILFVYRDLDSLLGKGSLKRMFFKSRKM